MKNIVDSLIEMQEGQLSRGVIEAFDTLKNIGLYDLKDYINGGNEPMIVAVGTTFEMNAIKKTLTEEELCYIREKSNAKAYKRLCDIILTYGELAERLYPYLANDSIVKQYDLLDEAAQLATKQDMLLGQLVKTVGNQDIVYSLGYFYKNIKNCKNQDRIDKFVTNDAPKISYMLNNGYEMAAINALAKYVLESKKTLAGMDDKVACLHNQAKKRILSIYVNGQLQNHYLDISKRLEEKTNQYNENDELVPKILKR